MKKSEIYNEKYIENKERTRKAVYSPTGTFCRKKEQFAGSEPQQFEDNSYLRPDIGLN